MPTDHAAYTDAVRAAADSALRAYGLPEPVRIEPIRLLNNAVFAVASADGRRFALRVHRPEFRSREHTLAELTFLAAVHGPLADHGVRVPAPQATEGGELAVTVDLGDTAAAPGRFHCDLLTWVDGRVHRPGTGLGPLGVRQIGRALAHLHRAAAAFEPPPGFSVPTWDAEAMFTERSQYRPGPFRDRLDRADLEVFDAVAEQTAQIFEDLGDDGDAFGLIHNDFILGNCHPVRTPRGWSVGVIDFDECGWGHFLYDLAPVMGNLSDYPHFRRLRAAFLDGYRSVRALPEHLEAHLPVLMAARHANHDLWASGLEYSNGSPGKTFLLEALCEATGGFYFAAEQATATESLRRLSEAVMRFTGSSLPISFTDWRQAIDALVALADDREIPVVIDEFPYLVRSSPSLPSVVQAALSPRRPERLESRARLLLCGSAMSFMGSLLSGSAPLRGRAGLELIVHTLDYRLAAEFWGIGDPVLAVKVNAIVGGTPAYRREFVADDVPAAVEDFDAWVLRTVLNPASPMFREARYLLSEEPGLRDPGLYHSVLAAVAFGKHTSGGIAAYVGRKSGDITHPLSVLVDGGLLRREADAFRANRSLYRIAEPLITFYQAIMRPDWREWEHGRDPEGLWRELRHRFDGNVIGPHFEDICRAWAIDYAPRDVFGGRVGRVASGTVNDPRGRTAHEVDLAVFGTDGDGRETLLAIGEVKWNAVMGVGHLDRLRRMRELLSEGGRFDTSRTRLACFSGAGFMPALQDAAAADEVVLVGLDDLYRA